MQVRRAADERASVARVPQWLAAILFLVYAAVLLLHHGAPQLGDLSNWAYSGQLLVRHWHGLPDPWHTLKHYPVPNSTLTLVFGLLQYLLPMGAAFKCLLLLYFLLCWCAVGALARAAESSSLVWLIAPSGFFLAVNFWYGFLAFQAGVALLFFLLAELLLAVRHGREPGQLRIAVLLLLLFVTHMVPFTFACLLLILFALQTGRIRTMLPLVPVALLLLWYAIGRVIGGNVDLTALPPVQPHGLAYFAAYKVGTFLKSFGLVNPVTTQRTSVAQATFGGIAFAALLCVNLVVCTCALALFWQGATRPGGRYSFVWLSSALALLVYPLLPQSMLGISDPGSRVLQTVLWTALFLCVPRGYASAALRVMAAGAVVLALAGLMLFARVPWQHEPMLADGRAANLLESLAGAPYSYAAPFLRDASHNVWDDAVFPTALFINHGGKLPQP